MSSSSVTGPSLIDLLGSIVDDLRGCLSIGPETELALESTSSLLTPEHVARLLAWGFTRLHVGVQSLDDGVRRTIGRRDTGRVVLERLQAALEAGMIVSVDLICGLPGETTESFCRSLEGLLAAGVHGVSVYRLQTTRRNEGFLRRTGAAERDPLHDYALLHTAAQALIEGGYVRTHFTHFARPEDTNLYYGHAIRGEDLLALGPTGDGVFGDYVYRHGELGQYESGVSVGLEGGVREPPGAARLRPARNALMACQADESRLEELGVGGLVETWLEQGVVAAADTGGDLRLTTSGCWFISDLLQELEQAAGSA